MFTKQDKPPILLPLVDDRGNDNGTILIWEKSIASVLYDHNFGRLAINLNQTEINIGTKLLLAEEHMVVTANGQPISDSNGRYQTQPTKKFRNDIYLTGIGGNSQILLTEEADIVRFFDWLGNPELVAILLTKRKEVLKRAEEVRLEAIRLRDEAIKAAEEEVKKKVQTASAIEEVEAFEQPELPGVS